MATIISDEELEELRSKRQPSAVGNASIISDEELESTRRKSPAEKNATATLGDYIRAVPATAVDITAGAAEGVASAIGEFTGDYGLARNIAEVRTDLNDAIMGDAPESVKSDFAYKIASGLGSTIPYLGAALIAKRPSLLTKVGANGFFLASAGQQVRDDYLATQGVTSETATDEQMSESVKLGAIGAVPIALAEKLGAGLILNPFTKGAIPAGQVMNRIGQYLSAGAGEAATEVAQSGIINAMASYVGKYDPDRPITQGMAESALIGFLVGGGVNAGVDTVERALTQGDRLKAGVQDGSINANDVIDEDVGSKFAAIAMENDSIPEADSNQQSTITDRNSMSNLISKSLTPLSRRLGRAGKEVVREFRKFELDTGLKLKEFKKATAPFSKRMLELKKKSPEDYRILSQALANANELSVSLPDSVQKDLEKKAQIQPEVAQSNSEQLLNQRNPEAQVINEQVSKVREASESLGLGLNVRIVESGNSYYDPNTRTIAVSATEADATTTGHEYLHAALGSITKNDLELQDLTKGMLDSVLRATTTGSSIHNQLSGFLSQYDENIRNEEFLAQTVGELAAQYETLDMNTKTRIKVWINQVMRKLGMTGTFKEADTDADVIGQLNAFARFAGNPEVLVEGKVSKDGIDSMVNGGANEEIIGATRASKFYLKDLSEAPRVVFPKKPLGMSRITEKNQFNLAEFLQTAKEQNLNIGFWGADQSGYGTWNNPVTGEDVFIDGGPSYAADPKGGIWAAAGGSKATKVDYVLQVSGHHEYMAMFNKSINAQFLKNIEKKHGSLQNFAKKYLEVMPKSKYMSGLQQKMFEVSVKGDKAFSDPDTLFGNVAKGGKDWANTRRTKFWKDVLGQSRQYKVKDPSTKYSEDTKVKPLEKLTDEIFPDFSTMRDEFFAGNDFKFLDIIGLIKVDGVKKGKSGHSTYPDALTGQYMGVPDIKVSVVDILSPEVVDGLQKEAEAAGKKNIPHSKFSGGAGIWTSRQGADFRTVTVADLQSTDKSLVGKPVVSKADDFAKAAKKLKKKQLAKVRGSVNFKKWMGKGQLVHGDGDPMVMYHGTKGDFTEFTSKENIDQDSQTPNWLYFGTNPELSEEMGSQRESYDEDGLDVDDRMQPYYEEYADLELDERVRIREEYAEKNGINLEGLRPMNLNAIGEDAYIASKVGMDAESYRKLDKLSIMPVYLNAKNIWNPSNPAHVDRLMAELRKSKEWTEELGWDRSWIESGAFRYIENVPTTEALKKLGYDGAFLSEDPDAGLSTVAIWDKNGVKSATGNDGGYSLENNDIRRQKSRVASEEEMMRGLSDDGMRVLEKYGMTEDYRGVRSVLDRIKAEYTELGMDANFIENYFPRYVSDLDGLKASYGQKTGVVDQEIRRYEKMTGRSLNEAERQMMFEKLARSKLYRSGVNAPSNMKERITDFIKEPQMKYYADPEVALDSYIDKMVNAIETKKLIGDTSAGKAKGADPVAGKLGEVMEKLSSEGRLRQDQIEVIQGAVAARFGQHGAQYGFIKGAKNMGYLATMGNVGSTLTQLGDFYFTMVQNGLIPTIEAAFGKKGLTVEDLGIAKDMVEIDSKQGAGMFSKSVNNVFKWTGLTAMDRLAKNTNINATFGVLTKGAKSGQNTNKYKKTLARLKRIQGDDAYKTISDLQRGVKSPYVIEAIYNELADVAPISLTEMPEAYAGNPNLRIMYSLKSYTIKQFNFVRERVFEKLYVGLLNKDPKMVGEASVDMARILAFSTLANGSADVLKAIIFNREIDEDDFMWDTLLRLFGVSKYTTVQMRKEGLDTAILKTIAPPQFGMMADVFKDTQEMDKISDMRSVKYMPFVGKLYYWAEGRGVETEERLSRLRSKDLAPSPLSKRKSPNPLGER